jgi:hypothetical protein
MFVLEPNQRGPQDPMAPTPPRLRGSIRRTSSIDTVRPDGLDGRLVVTARARDLMTSSDRDLKLDEVQVTVDLEPHGVVRDVDVHPKDADLEDLVGLSVGPGFRASVKAANPDLATSEPLLHLLVDDLPGAVLVSGYARLHSDAMGQVAAEGMERRADMCAGWVSEGVMMTSIRERGRVPTPIGPPSPPLTRDDDPMAWHRLDPLPPSATRRVRRIDVTPHGDTGLLAVDSMFRDSHFGEGSSETSVHEYSVEATVRADTRVITSIAATPHVLPWVECPNAIDSAKRLVGVQLDDLRHRVRTSFTGPSTCTHLNDTLRCLEGVAGLLARLPDQR